MTLTDAEASALRQHLAHLRTLAKRFAAANQHERARLARNEASAIEARLRDAGHIAELMR
jgi:hypothetical protein